MTDRTRPDPGRWAAAVLITLAVAVGWYAIRPIQPPCTIYSGAYIAADTSPTDADTASREAYDRAYEQALADGTCQPARPRFRTWID